MFVSSPYSLPPRELGKAIRARREAVDLTQKDAADQLAVSVRTIQLWESGSRPSVVQRRRIRQWLVADDEASVA